MSYSTPSVFTCRAIVLLLMFLVWFLFFLNGRYAYHPGGKTKALRLLLVAGSAAAFCVQVFAMERLNPADAYGNHFFLFVLTECLGALVVLFWTLLRERAKARGKLTI